MEKRELRNIVRELKKRYSHNELIEMSLSIVLTLEQRLMKEDGYKTILLYHSLPDEVFTHQLIDNLFKIGKKVLLPTVVGNDLELHEYVGAHHCEISEQFSIKESNGPLFCEYDKIDIAIIPGMAFTNTGDRLGRGKGYYDRLLPKLKCPLLGLAFPFQVVDNIPCESHDVKMDEIVTSTLLQSSY